MIRGHSLFARLSLLFALLLLALGIFIWVITHYTQQRHSEEYAQELNRSVAMYIANNIPVLVNGAPDEQVLAELASRAMLLNPKLEIYLLDQDGSITASAIGDSLEDSNASALQNTVALAPIKAFLEADVELPVYGDDPRRPGVQQVFSAFALEDSAGRSNVCSPCGYVYAVIAGERPGSAWLAFTQSQSMRMSLYLLGSVILCALIASILLFSALTRPLRNMTQVIRQWQLIASGSNHGILSMDGNTATLHGNELQVLEQTCREMATRLSHQYKVLDDSDRRRRRFLTSISHDLRTPLTSVCAALETLIERENYTTESEEHRYLQLANRQAGRLNQLIDQVFELARLDSGEISLQLESMAIQELAMDTVQELSPQAEKRSIRLDLVVADSSNEFYVDADMAQINRVMVNLLSNSLRHTPVGGTIRLSLSVLASRNVLVVVEDSGCGFPEKLHDCDLRELTSYSASESFTAHQCFDKGCEEGSHGTGLGLSIVSGILALHGTQARVTSEPGAGSRVSFQLPLSL